MRFWSAISPRSAPDLMTHIFTQAAKQNPHLAALQQGTTDFKLAFDLEYQKEKSAQSAFTAASRKCPLGDQNFYLKALMFAATDAFFNTYLISLLSAEPTLGQTTLEKQTCIDIKSQIPHTQPTGNEVKLGNVILGEWITTQIKNYFRQPTSEIEREMVFTVLLHFAKLGAFLAFQHLDTLLYKQLITLTPNNSQEVIDARAAFRRDHQIELIEQLYGKDALMAHYRVEMCFLMHLRILGTLGHEVSQEITICEKDIQITESKLLTQGCSATEIARLTAEIQKDFMPYFSPIPNEHCRSAARTASPR